MRVDDGRALPTLLSQALRGEPLTVYGSGRQTRAFGYVDDTVDGLYRLLMSDEALPVNVGSDEERTLVEFAELVRFAAGSSSEIAFEALPEDDPQVRRPDLTKARTRLGYEPRVPLAEGLARTVGYFRERVL